MLVELPLQLSTQILREWLCFDHDLSSLDVAYCNGEKRLKFLSILSIPRFQLLVHDYRLTNTYFPGYLQWILSRNIHVLQEKVHVEMLRPILDLPNMRALASLRALTIMGEEDAYPHDLAQFLAYCPNVTTIDLSTDLSPQSFESLIQCPKLIQIHISPELETTNLPFAKVLSPLSSQLCSLHINEMVEVTRDDLTAIARCTSLVDLSIPFTASVADEDLLHLCQSLPDLTRLTLMDSSAVISNDLMATIVGTCPQIRSLTATHCDEVTHDQYCLLLESCSWIEEFCTPYWSYHRSVGSQRKKFQIYADIKSRDEVLKALRACPTDVVKLNLNHEAISFVDLPEIADKFGPTLRSLRLLIAHDPLMQHLAERDRGGATTNPYVSSLLYLFHRCDLLETIQLLGARLATDEVLLTMAERCPRLEKVHLMGLPKVTDHGLEKLLKGLPKLRSLTLGGMNSLTGKSMSLIAICCPRLEELVINCPKINGNHILQGIRMFKRKVEITVSAQYAPEILYGLRVMGRSGMEWLRRMTFV